MDFSILYIRFKLYIIEFLVYIILTQIKSTIIVIQKSTTTQHSKICRRINDWLSYQLRTTNVK